MFTEILLGEILKYDTVGNIYKKCSSKYYYTYLRTLTT